MFMYLTGSAVKSVRQELQLSDSSDLCGHLNHSDQLLAVQTPQVDQVGAATSSKALTITAKHKSGISGLNRPFSFLLILTFE